MKIFALLVVSSIAATAAAADYPPAVRALMQQGVQVASQFDAGGGIKGYAARVRGEPLALYLMPDGKQLIVGTMLDANGADLSLTRNSKKHLPEARFRRGMGPVGRKRPGYARAQRLQNASSMYSPTPNALSATSCGQRMQPERRQRTAGAAHRGRRAEADELRQGGGDLFRARIRRKACVRHETAYAQGGIEAMRRNRRRRSGRRSSKTTARWRKWASQERRQCSTRTAAAR